MTERAAVNGNRTSKSAEHSKLPQLLTFNFYLNNPVSEILPDVHFVFLEVAMIELMHQSMIHFILHALSDSEQDNEVDEELVFLLDIEIKT